jgi:hypothetical protein
MFPELRVDGVLGSCAIPTNPSHWTSLINAAGLISPLLCGERRCSNSPIAKEAVNKGSEQRKVTRKEVPF